MQAYYWTIEQLPGLSQQQQTQLKDSGITTTQQLLKQGQTVPLKQALANQLGMNILYINKWIALADLARLPSVGCEYCGLLLHSGVASVNQLSQTPVHRLHRQILRLKVATLQTQELSPPVELIQQWIKEARVLFP